MGSRMVEQLPEHVVALMRSGRIAEFVTTSAAGVPIDTPTLYFPSAALDTLDVATGLAYPVKAERARSRPMVGMLIEGGAGEPVISIAGMAAVRDQNLQANTVRYLAETAQNLPAGADWSLARHAVWYWTRIIVEVMPARILWWDDASAMAEPPHRWDAPAGTVFPASDPAPAGKPSSASPWPQAGWQDLAAKALERMSKAHISLFDDAGFPLPFPVDDVSRTPEGFVMTMPRGVPWLPRGKTSLSFEGVETFIGDAAVENGRVHVVVDRALPQLPTMTDYRNLFDPYPDIRASFMDRLEHETQRRGQPIPTIPADRPEPTEWYKLRLIREKTAPSRGN